MRLAASAPPEQRGLARDEVRLLVATPDGLVHARFRDLPRFLAPGDLLVVNTSATVAAAAEGRRPDGHPVTVHLSGPVGDGTWLVELRTPLGAPRPAASRPAAADAPAADGPAGTSGPASARPGDTITLPGGASVTLLRHYPDGSAARMWTATFAGTGGVRAFFARCGQPVRYSYVPQPQPLAAYQTVFARSSGRAYPDSTARSGTARPGAGLAGTGLDGTGPDDAGEGSAEMPSAGRPFTAELVTGLIAAGVLLAPVTLHAGVASLEAGEPPLPEWFIVPEPTAQLVNLTRAAGRRVVAVGTTSTRALESAAGPDGTVHAERGQTSLVLGTQRPARVVSGLITGWHDPEASHLALLEAVAGTRLVQASYAAAEQAGYLWHEFGDSSLLLPPPGPPAPGQLPSQLAMSATTAGSICWAGSYSAGDDGPVPGKNMWLSAS